MASVPESLAGRIAALRRRQQQEAAGHLPEQEQQQQQQDERQQQEQQQQSNVAAANALQEAASLEASIANGSSYSHSSDVETGAAWPTEAPRLQSAGHHDPSAAAASQPAQQQSTSQRWHLLQQRHARQQAEASADTAAARFLGSGCQALQQGDFLQRLQLLQRRDACQQQAASVEDNAAGASLSCQPDPGQQQAAMLSSRLQRLQQRYAQQAALGFGSGLAQTSANDGTLLRNPEDFVDCMQQLLATEDFAEEMGGVYGGEIHHEDANMACRDTESGEDAALCADGVDAAAAADGGGGADSCGGVSSLMRTSPVSCQGPAAAAAAAPDALQHPQQQQQQQQQQQHLQQQQQQDPAPEPAILPGHLRRLLVLASHSLSAGQYAEARERAAAALTGAAGVYDSGNSSSLKSFTRDAERLLAMAIVLEEVGQQRWLAALQLAAAAAAVGMGSSGLGAGTTAAAAAAVGAATDDAVVTPAAVKSAYRRLAALVHPDKCRHPCAEAAFKALTTAYQQALMQLRGPAAGAADNDTVAEAEFWGADTEADQQQQQQEGGDSDHAWWTEWEADVRDGHVDGAAAAGGAWGSSKRSQPTTADEEEELWKISMQELIAEVERRQAGVLQPQSPEDAARTPVARQKRLRVARTVLSARLQQHRPGAAGSADGGSTTSSMQGAAAAGGGGGFVVGGDDVGSTSADKSEEWADWKRQRL